MAWPRAGRKSEEEGLKKHEPRRLLRALPERDEVCVVGELACAITHTQRTKLRAAKLKIGVSAYDQ